MSDERTFISIQRMATRLGVPRNWLIREIEAGRVPHLKAGRTVLLNPDLVEQALLQQAEQSQRQEVMSS